MLLPIIPPTRPTYKTTSEKLQREISSWTKWKLRYGKVSLVVRSTSQQHHYLVRLFQILPFEWFRLHCLYSCIAWGKIHYILNWMICYELRSALNIRICPCFFTLFEMIYLPQVAASSVQRREALPPNPGFFSHPTYIWKVKDKPCHVTDVMSTWNVIKYIYPFV